MWCFCMVVGWMRTTHLLFPLLQKRMKLNFLNIEVHFFLAWKSLEIRARGFQNARDEWLTRKGKGAMFTEWFHKWFHILSFLDGFFSGNKGPRVLKHRNIWSSHRRNVELRYLDYKALKKVMKTGEGEAKSLWYTKKIDGVMWKWDLR